MPLIVEDGTGKEDANSFVSLEEARTIAGIRGIVLPADDETLTGILVGAADRIVSYEQRFTGTRKTGEQGLSYPRVRALRYGMSISDTNIPKELKLAQVTLAGFVEEGFDLWATLGNEGVTREKVGPLEIEYAEALVTNSDNPYFAQIESILNPLFAPLSINFIVSR